MRPLTFSRLLLRCGMHRKPESRQRQRGENRVATGDQCVLPKLALRPRA